MFAGRSQYWPYCQEKIVPFIQTVCPDQFTEDEIMRAIGILEVNCYEVRNYVTFGVRGFYPLASLLSHSCVANCRTIWDAEAPFGHTTIAVTRLNKGGLLPSNTSFDLPGPRCARWPGGRQSRRVGISHANVVVASLPRSWAATATPWRAQRAAPRPCCRQLRRTRRSGSARSAGAGWRGPRWRTQCTPSARGSSNSTRQTGEIFQ